MTRRGRGPGRDAVGEVGRRELLAGAGALGVGALAGCLGLGGGGGDVPDVDCSADLPHPVRGDPESDVTVVAFEDYACPHCQHYVLEVVPKLVADYIDPGKIRYEHWDFPIPVQEPQSYEAANAARAVQEDAGVEAFWSYNRALYENQGSLSLDTYASLASDVGADTDFVRGAAANQCYKDMIAEERQTGIDRGVRGTPTVFVDDTKLTAPSYDDLSSAIDAHL